ncbi:MAG: type VI secretion system baseplate subunit TssK [Deltaproteobacteria bacterium]|jgi:type VI secretion system protein ImpJ|nr:type VI secretion system baseplate subunit TssK [Deltaproteobacteria bacterium]
MAYDCEINWRQGTFLEPQHFQLQELRHRTDLAYIIGNLEPYGWGLTKLQINANALQNGFFEVTELELWLSEGRRIIFPGNTNLRASDYRLALAEEALTVYLGIPFFHLTGDNLNPRHLRSPDAARGNNISGPAKYLFTEANEPELVPDLLGKGQAGRVEMLTYNVGLIFGEPARAADDSVLTLPLAKLIREGETVKLEKNFAPPALTLYSSHPVRDLIKDVYDMLQASAGRLDDYRVDPGQSPRDESGGRTQVLVTLLGVLGRHIPIFHLLLAAPVIHPYAAYVRMCQLYGELGVFSLRGAGHSISRSVFTPPNYDHDNCWPGFEMLASVIIRLLESIAIGPEMALPFERHDEFFELLVPEEIGESTTCWLTVRTDQGVAETVDFFLKAARLGPKEKMGTLIAHALPGVALTCLKSAPPGFRQRPDTFWCAIRQKDPLWSEVITNRSVEVFWDSAPESAQLFLVAARTGE